MILEALTWLTTPAPVWARKTGYLRELIAIEARHRRRQRDWAPHLEATRIVIREAIERCGRRRQALIYGSGLLLDIPLDALSAAFETVTLVDAAHLRRTRRTARRFGNVGCIEADISGVAIGLQLGIAKGADTLPRPIPPVLADNGSVDLVVSANLLTQLPLMPLHFLDRHPNFSEQARQDYARAIMQAHLDHLTAFDATCCLVAETEVQFIAADGSIQRTEDPLRGLSLPSEDRSWFWEVAPRGEVSQSYGVRNIITATTTAPSQTE
ncbi:MAG: hypothetical protein GKS00_17995 [Alphaproteobacteria bacterium]|nr:hypothetical protein [Alphaproteobacteria bacterium]